MKEVTTMTISNPMPAVKTPCERIHEIVENAGSGELICAGNNVEVHMYFQDGRIAWAIDSQRPRAFSRRIQELASIDSHTLREVVEECRRDRLPLGETLVSWGLSSWDAVRAALQHQIAHAMNALLGMKNGQTLFLDRDYPHYNERLTFALEEVLPEVRADAAEGHTLITAALRGDRPAATIRRGVADAKWVEVLDEERAVDGDPPCPGQRTAIDLARQTLLDGASFVGLRGAHSSILGARGSAPTRSVWFGCAADACFGRILASLRGFMELGDINRADCPPTIRVVPPEVAMKGQDAPESELGRRLQSFMARAPAVRAVVVVRGSRGAHVRLAAARDGRAASMCEDLARRRLAVLTTAMPPDEVRVDQHSWREPDGAAKTLITREECVWCFGVQLDAAGEYTLWFLLGRDQLPGLGFAYATSLARAVGELVSERTS